MKYLDKTIVAGIAAAIITASSLSSAGGNGKRVIDSESASTLDFNEETHLVFMREEEKLARDVYIFLGSMYPDSKTFGNIDDSEQRHTDAVLNVLNQYGIKDPSTNDNPGVFTGDQYGEYFAEKYSELTAWGGENEFEALRVGAFIEEIDMHDINRCTVVIVDMYNDIGKDECGKIYTDNTDIHRLYESLLEGSESHLQTYVKQIEVVIGEGNYEAQYLSQEEVDAILGR